MRIITITDMRRRVRCLREQESAPQNTAFIESANVLSTSGRVHDIKRLIESMVTSNANIPFRSYAKLYDALVERGTISDIEKIGIFIAEEAMPKVRDATQTLQLIHRRLGRTKSKVGNTSYMHKAQENLQNTLATINTSSGQPYTSLNPDDAPSISPEEIAANEAYHMMYDSMNIYSHCDRVLENYDRISKRFNLEILFNENTRANGIYDTVVELCNLIDTYNMPITVKFNTVI